HSPLKKASLRCRRLVAITSRSQRVQTTPSAETVGVNSSSSSCAFVQVANDLHYVMVFNRLDLIGKRDEPSINRIQFATRQLKPKSLTFAPKRMPPRMLPQYQPVVRHTYRLRRHDLVGQSVLNNTVLMNPSLVRKRVAPDYRLVWLNVHTGDLRQQLATPIQLRRSNRRVERHHTPPTPQRHNYLFQGGVSRPLPNSIYRALNLPGSGFQSRDRVRHRKPQIVVTVHRDHRLVDPSYPRA